MKCEKKVKIFLLKIINYKKSMENKKNHYIIRVGDGSNFEKSGFTKNIWGLTTSRNVTILPFVKKIKKGDILWFSTKLKSKYNGRVIAVCEYIGFTDRHEEIADNFKSLSNIEAGWQGDKDWNIQIFFENVYDIRNLKIKVIYQHATPIFSYNNYVNQRNKRDKPFEDLHKHYDNIKYYLTPHKLKEKNEKIKCLEYIIIEQQKKIENLEESIKEKDKKYRDVVTHF